MLKVRSLVYAVTLFSINGFASEMEDNTLTERAFSQLSRRREGIKEEKKEVAHSDYLQLHVNKSIPEKPVLIAESSPEPSAGLKKKKFVLKKQLATPQEVIPEEAVAIPAVDSTEIKEVESIAPAEQELIVNAAEEEKIPSEPLVEEATLPDVEIAQNEPVPPPTFPVETPTQMPNKPNYIGVHVWDHHATFRSLFGDGIGFDRGYTSLDLFLSGECKSYWRPFIDLRGHLFDNSRWAANAGLGLRRKGTVRNLIAGANLYYDYRETKHKSFNQLGGGLELLGSLWDFRLNGYLPFDASHSFDGNNGHKRHVIALGGGNIEVERILWWSRNLDISAALSGYYLHGSDSKNAGGGLFRLVAHATPYMIFRGQISYDNLFHLRGSGEIALNYPFGGKKTVSKPKHRTIIEEKVRRSTERFEIIPVYESKKH